MEKPQYNELQLKAINCTDPRIVVTAPAGSGKTLSLVGAIGKYKEEHPHDRVVAITFTRKAAAELNLKLYDYPDVLTSTIHSWSYKELGRLAMEHGFVVSILEDEQIQEMLKVLARRLGYWSINMFLLFSYIMGNYNIDVSQGTKVKFERVASAYVEYKRKNKLYDFTDLPLYLFDVLNEYNETITNIDGLFVDEYQDVDKVQAQIFTKVNAKKHFYIGDTDQAIYGFRGADSSVIDNLQGFTRIRLEENYRSYQSIVDFATTARDYTCITDIRELKPSWIKAVRKEASGEVFMINEDGECFDFVKKTKPEMDTVLTNFIQYKPYILCRSNKQVKYIQQCGYNNVSTVHQAKGLEYPYVIVAPFVIDSDEEKNVFYVACTRAQNGLLVCDYAVLLSFLQDNCDEIAPEIIF